MSENHYKEQFEVAENLLFETVSIFAEAIRSPNLERPLVQQIILHLSEERVKNNSLRAELAAIKPRLDVPKKFALGDYVQKKSGSAWSGKVVGWYSTELTPEGYAVESDAHPGSVQIYPAAALEAVPPAQQKESE